MEKKDKPKDPRGRAFKRKQYTRRFVTAGRQGSAVGGAGEDKRAVGGGRSTRHCSTGRGGSRLRGSSGRGRRSRKQRMSAMTLAMGAATASRRIGKTTLSFDSKKITMAIGGCHLRNCLAAAASQKRGFCEEAKKKKRKEGRADGRSVSPSATKKVLWHIAMLCFVGKQRSLLEKSTSGWLQPSVVGKQRSLLEEADSCVATVEGHD
ncbi:hypothetical protein BHE74_00028892 [Ensete ventricosum]|nr:hypothetical protein BHE74_00028892 [Ensete ventricosum]